MEVPIDRHSEGFRLITRIQDEAHRFAIEYHRSLRGKGQVKSILDDIPGIGPARRKALMRHFKDIEAVRSASVEDLEQTPQMNRRSAESVYRFFHLETGSPRTSGQAPSQNNDRPGTSTGPENGTEADFQNLEGQR